MPVADLLLAGVELMCLGMGIVFGFLVILVFAMSGMSRLVLFVEQGQSKTLTETTQPPQGGDTKGLRGDLVAVISAAVSRYRTTHS
jgi:oxaloacetate decarboxylase gamma subunit